MPATSTMPAPLEGQHLSRRDCEMPPQSLRRLFDRSDQINQNSRGILVPPRGAGQTVQKAISLQCRKIRIFRHRSDGKSKLCSLLTHIATCSIAQSSGACPALRRSANRKTRKAEPSPARNWWSLTGSNRRHPACKAGALPAELRPHS